MSGISQKKGFIYVRTDGFLIPDGSSNGFVCMELEPINSEDEVYISIYDNYMEEKGDYFPLELGVEELITLRDWINRQLKPKVRA